MLKKSVLLIAALLPAAVWAEFGALVIGRSPAQTWVVGHCTDQPNKAKALKCAEKKFKESGGLLVTGTRDWKCKGWLAASVSAGGGFGIAWCRQTEVEAVGAATSACMNANKGRDCAPIFKKDDTN